MRLVARAEGLLPARVRLSLADAAWADASRKERRHPRGWALAALLPSLAVALVQVVRQRADLIEAWPAWQPLLLDLLVLLASATLVAAAAAGVHAWRHHA